MEVFSSSLIFWPTLLVVIIFIWYWLFKTSRFRKLVDDIPGPPGFLCFGNTFDLAKGHSEIINTALGWYKEYGKHKVYKVIIGRNTYVNLSAASSVEVVLGSSYITEKPIDYSWMKPWLGNGLLVSKGEKWKKRRKLLTPAFHFRILEEFVSVFNDHSKILVKQLLQKLGNGQFDIFPFITLCTLDIICETAMGCHTNAQVEKESEYVRALKEISGIIKNRMISPWFHIEWIFRLHPVSKKHDHCLKILHGFTKKVIKERKKEFSQMEIKSEENKDDVLLGKKKRLAFLDLLLETSQHGQILSDDDIQEEVDTFMFEGHDTTASAISSVLYLLGRNPVHQLKVLQELDEFLGVDDDKHISLEDLRNLKYLECVIKESLRLLPPIPIITRKLTKDVTIENHLIPAGVTIQICPFIIHRDPEVFPEPEKFDPDRFTIENTLTRNPYAYVPFSAGPRNCIGQKFAMTEMKIILAHVLRKFTLKSTQSMEELKLTPELVLSARNGFNVMLTSRS